jgi:hypothetical protein
MKKILPFLLLVGCLFLHRGGNAQNFDLKLNVGSALTLSPGVTGEYAFNDNHAALLSANYSDFRLTADGDRYSLQNFRFVPEYRYYFAPREGGDGVFAGAYSKIGWITGSADESGEDVRLTRLALAGTAGYKWITNGGIVLELNAGLGKGFIVGSDQGGAVTSVATALSWIDFRLGIMVGYRF